MSTGIFRTDEKPFLCISEAAADDGDRLFRDHDADCGKLAGCGVDLCDSDAAIGAVTALFSSSEWDTVTVPVVILIALMLASVLRI